MPRIVAGRAKGRVLAVPPHGTRPTADRAREGLFNTLAGLLDLAGAHVLDLFAGSGAVGLEASSRGAAVVTLVESDRSAAEVIARNITTVGLPGAQVMRRSVEAFLAGPADEPYDLVFADPPYALRNDELARLLQQLLVGGWLAEDAVVVVERSARTAPIRWPDAIETTKQKRYGEGMLWYGRYRGPDGGASAPTGGIPPSPT